MTATATKADQRLAVIDEANRVVASFNRHWRFELRNGRLWVVGETKAKAAVVNPHSGVVAFRYGAFGMGGTQATACFNLIRWIRGETRYPLSAWRYWTGPKMRMGDGTTYDLIASSSYPDPAMTRCVLCGLDDPPTLDWWWNADGKVGPCCTFGACQNKAGGQ